VGRKRQVLALQPARAVEEKQFQRGFDLLS
jgi:hypothetical protein